MTSERNRIWVKEGFWETANYLLLLTFPKLKKCFLPGKHCLLLLTLPQKNILKSHLKNMFAMWKLLKQSNIIILLYQV